MVFFTCYNRNNFENIYIGWGLKYSSTPFNPLLPPAVQDEFPTGNYSTCTHTNKILPPKTSIYMYFQIHHCYYTCIQCTMNYMSSPTHSCLPFITNKGADITETKDPTAEEEAALKALQEEAEKAAEEEEEPEDSEDEG